MSFLGPVWGGVRRRRASTVGREGGSVRHVSGSKKRACVWFICHGREYKILVPVEKLVKHKVLGVQGLPAARAIDESYFAHPKRAAPEEKLVVEG